MASVLKRPAASIVGLILALGWPLLLPLIPAQTHQNAASGAQDIGIVIAEWVMFCVIAAIVVFGERLPFAQSVGMRRPPRAAAIAIAAVVAIVIIVSFALASGHVAVDPKARVALAGYASLPLLLRIVLVTTAAICEETLFRGYAIERLTSLTGNAWLGALIANVFFALGHVARYGFSGGLVAVFVIGAILALIYLWKRNLWPCIVAHWLIDGTSLIIIPAVVLHH